LSLDGEETAILKCFRLRRLIHSFDRIKKQPSIRIPNKACPR
jgi:hypothetical protein